MPAELSASVSFADADIRRFLGNENEQKFALEPEASVGFSNDIHDRRPSINPTTGAQESHVEIVPFLMDEVYRLVADGIPTGTHHVTVGYSHDIAITCEFWLYLGEISEEKKAYARNAFASYDPLTDGPDLQGWIDNVVAGHLNNDDYELKPCLILAKTQAQPAEVDTRQRDALFQLLGIQNPSPEVRGVLDITGGDTTYREWAVHHHANLRPISRTVILDDEPQADPNLVREVPNQNGVGAIIDDIVDALVPTQCGAMRQVNKRLLTVGGWPEFKVEWVNKRIKVGCCRITITVPVLRIRFCELVFYVYFKLPQNAFVTVVKIVETCAIRSALTSAIIGVITSNIAAAVASFVPVFRNCVQNEIIECLHPGLLLLKEPGPWN